VKLSEHLTVADGYLELGMYRDALDVLEEIVPETEHEHFQVIRKRLTIWEAVGDWAQGARTAREAVLTLPNYADLYLKGAYAIRRAESVESALEFLKSGEHCCSYTSLWWYYLGCYYCVLGRIDDAKKHVYKAVGFGKRALQEKDLEPLWDEFRAARWAEEDEEEGFD
tara:strand:+ start:3717 stop:4220 length:504 start_codon:yes stop_codon:yes gene_type:complete